MDADEMSEGEAISEWEMPDLEANYAQKERDYYRAKMAKVGTVIICPWCGKRLIKRTYQHKFCSTTHKDRYHNTINPEKQARARCFNSRRR